jgi:hypothetical protein
MGDDTVLRAVELLTGLEPSRVAAAREVVSSWGLAHVSAELLAGTVDAAVAATLLVEGAAHLVDRGVEARQIRRKLRLDRDVWGTFAEIRAADLLLRGMGGDVEVRLEHERSRGAHPDFRFFIPELQTAQSVEVKAIGLSDEEVRFCQRMAPSLAAVLPPIGLVHVHAAIGGVPPEWPRGLRRDQARRAKKAAAKTQGYPKGLRGAVIVAHGSEDAYVRRAVGRVIQAIRQLPPYDECWVAIYWSNGAPLESVHRALRWPEIPAHVAGIALLGCGVAFPHPEIHCFSSWLHRDASEHDEVVVASANPGQDELASEVLKRFDRSSGVRATLLSIGDEIALLRDGGRRLLPFNLLLDPDPPGLDRNSTAAPWSS